MADANGPRPTSRTPRWVWVFGIIAIIVLVGRAILVFGPGGGGHGPSRHGLA